jgi:hypothetical protein
MNSPEKIILLIERDNWQKDNELNHVLLKYLKTTKQEIVWEDPAGKLLYRFRSFENQFQWLPEYVKTFNLRLIQLLYGFFHWNYFSYLSNRRNQMSEVRIQKLRQTLLNLKTKKEIVILSRSAGGRFSSRIADEFNINHIICLGYPFQHPHNGIEPDRYSHLQHLKTPMLIVQGENDEYGGLDIQGKYALSPAIELLFVDTNHDFKLSENEWNRVLNKIQEIIVPSYPSNLLL